MAEVHGNRTHRGDFSSPPPVLKTGRPTSDRRTSIYIHLSFQRVMGFDVLVCINNYARYLFFFFTIITFFRTVLGSFFDLPCSTLYYTTPLTAIFYIKIIPSFFKHKNPPVRVIFMGQFFSALGYQLLAQSKEPIKGYGSILPHPTRRLFMNQPTHASGHDRYVELAQACEGVRRGFYHCPYGQ